MKNIFASNGKKQETETGRKEKSPHLFFMRGSSVVSFQFFVFRKIDSDLFFFFLTFSLFNSVFKFWVQLKT